MAKRKRKLDPERFKKEEDTSLFSFGPNRRNIFKWGLIAGAGGGVLMLRPEIVWQILGVLVVVLVSNHHINKASRRMPRWHATIISFLGVMLAMFGTIIAGTALITYLQGGGGGG